ncbi:Periplasmic binding proteins and sugar binding domain of LacI family [Seminavis robusta]|uniref:Periplasmic binding proteins and sugar binding domain of LacI family n=1 Tax=Seminavis robusta TaxID=568900 RepID=A0A9N8DL64_9STRA|nr:Periplasmic binding proteins and sugar binding domain of LacI family [Seminavis robusta]|eukprot:Sro145_g067270.1 Periplasmic binding proteins and sugar binding domain of LacI family (1133) ;mRNA; f:40709-44351
MSLLSRLCLFAGLVYTTTTVATASSSSIRLDCDPCIDRTVTRLGAILPDFVPRDGVIASAFHQAASDMNVDLSIYTDSSFNFNNDEEAGAVDAWLVHLGAQDAIMESRVRDLALAGEIFVGWGWGYQSTVARQAVGWMASNDAEGGRMAANETLQFLGLSRTNPTKELRVAYVVDPTSIPAQAQLRSDTYKEQLITLLPNSTNVMMDTVSISDTDITSDAKLVSLFQNCPRQAILLDTPQSVTTALQLKETHNCTHTSLGAFLDNFQSDLNPTLYRAITRQQLQFVLDPEIHLQSSMAVVLSSLYLTTGKKPAFPRDIPTYWTGPTLIHPRNVPSDTTAVCQKTAFPVCDPTTTTQADDTSMAANAERVDWWGLDQCPCTPRHSLRIGGVLHGTPGGFWDPVFASARQAARDMRIELELTPFDSKEDFDLLVDQMSARIRNLCESGRVDGLVVSIPHPRVARAVQRCLDLFTPVISVNSGIAESQRLGLMHHIGQNEYAGGYEAGQRLIQAGMTRGFCVDHEYGNSALAERCQGFKDAIADSEQPVEFRKHVAVPRDNDAEFRIAIENAVGRDWKGVGFLQLSASSFRSLRSLLEEHPGTLAGSFDLKDYIYEAIQDGVLLFTVDQQPFLQGNLPIYLLTYYMYTRQTISNHLIQSGPSFVESPPSEAQKICEANHFRVCPDRPEEDMTFISDGFLTVGYVLFSIVAVCAVAAMAWTCINRKLWVVRASQPLFLGLITGGVFISSLSILFLGAQTAYRLDQDEYGDFTDAENPDIQRVDASCMAVPWLYGMGFVIIFSALFAKIHRVRMICQAGRRMTRKAVTAKDVLPIMGCLLLVEGVILASWQIAAPLTWQREVKDEVDGYSTKSVGGCTSGLDSNEGWGFFLGLMGFHVICLLYALVLSYQVRHLDSDFAESSYVSLAVAFLFQVLVLSIPLMALVEVRRMHEVQAEIRRSQQERSLKRASLVAAAAPALNEETTPAPHGPLFLESDHQSLSGQIEQASRQLKLETGDKGDGEVLRTTSSAGMEEMVLSETERASETQHLGGDGINGSTAESGSSQDCLTRRHSPNSTTTDVMLSSDEILSSWEDLGFPSEDFTQRIVEMLSRSTDSSRRQAIASQLLGGESKHLLAS